MSGGSSGNADALAPDVARLDGVHTEPALASRLPLAVMIDDNVQARPQAGFNAASVVYQAPADGGEDRYMLVFQEGDAATVGPVRSGRPYFVRWASEFRSAFGHFGGDAKTLQQVIPGDGRIAHLRRRCPEQGRWGVPPDQDASGAPQRVHVHVHAAKGRRSPRRSGGDGGRSRPLAVHRGRAGGRAPGVGLDHDPYGRGDTGYTYDPKANAYLRSVAGKAQTDQGDGKRVTARNVIVMFQRLSYDPESEPGYRRPILDQIGSGDAIVFRDGRRIGATWKKDEIGGLTRFFDAAGDEIGLVRGRTFIQVVPTGTKVTSTFR